MSYLSMRRGDDRTLTITATEDLTGSDVFFTAKRHRRDDDVAAIIAKSTDNGGVSVATDVATVTIDAVDTDGITDVPVALYWDVEVVDVTDKRRTVATGRLGILPDITRGS